MSKLDIAEEPAAAARNKIRFQDAGATKEIDFRVSCLPTSSARRSSCVC
jgi:hypothetical protein